MTVTLKTENLILDMLTFYVKCCRIGAGLEDGSEVKVGAEAKRTRSLRTKMTKVVVANQGGNLEGRLEGLPVEDA
jgi:hypothetical protein